MRQIAACLIVLALAMFAYSAKPSKDQVLVSFSGTLKRVTRKSIVITTDSDNEMSFIRTGRTTFTSAGRVQDGSGLPSGIVVTIQAFEKLNRELEAVSVTVATPDQSPNK